MAGQLVDIPDARNREALAIAQELANLSGSVRGEEEARRNQALSLVGFLWAFHALLRRRMAAPLAFATVAAVGTTVAYVQHTDSVLSELPYMWAVAVTLWWLDRLRRDGRRLHDATRNELVVLGLLVVLAFNVRREQLASRAPARLLSDYRSSRGCPA